MKTLTFNISDESYELLIKIKKEGYAEYRDKQFETLEDFIKSEAHKEHNKTVEWFLSRNFDGTLKHIPELLKHGLIHFDDLCWNDTYVLTILGKKVTE
jgi:predicted CopG family antitoxin